MQPSPFRLLFLSRNVSIRTHAYRREQGGLKSFRNTRTPLSSVELQRTIFPRPFSRPGWTKIAAPVEIIMRHDYDLGTRMEDDPRAYARERVPHPCPYVARSLLIFYGRLCQPFLGVLAQHRVCVSSCVSTAKAFFFHGLYEFHVEKPLPRVFQKNLPSARSPLHAVISTFFSIDEIQNFLSQGLFIGSLLETSNELQQTLINVNAKNHPRVDEIHPFVPRCLV